MVVLNHITSAIDRNQRVKLNENWEIIREAFVNIQRQINILAGEEVDELLARIAKAIESSETSVGEINQLITDVEQKLLEVGQATTTANESAQNADNKASLADTATINANDARDGALQAIADTRVVLEDFTTRMTTALTNAEVATTSANDATTETLAAKVKAEEALVEAGESKGLADQAIIDANNALTTANQASEKANQAAENIAGYDLPIVDFVIGDTYIKHQAVRDNGSTYRAKVETTGNPLPVSPNTETEFWTLEAKAGRDGKGTVQSVNNELPDEDGNVTIVIPPTDWEDVPNKPTEFTPIAHTQPMATIEELDATLQAINDSIALIGQTGIPKLVSYPFVVDIVEDQTTYKIPLVSFDKSNDTLFVFKNTIVLYEQEHYTVNSQNEVVLNDAPLAGKMLFVILKNVPIGPSGSVSGSVIADGTLTKNKLEQSIQDILDNSSRELAVGAPTEVNLVRDFNVLNVATKSLAEVKRINGRTVVNLAPLFDSGVWVSYNSTFIAISPNEIKITPTNDTHFIRVDLPAKGGSTYTISAILGSGSKFGIDAIDSSGTIINASGGGSVLPLNRENVNSTETFTLPVSATGLRIYLARKSGASAETATVKNLVLVEGSTAQPFVANVKGVTNPTIVNETNDTSMVVPTTLYDGEYVEQNEDGELVKFKKWNEIKNLSQFEWEHASYPFSPTHKTFKTSNGNFKLGGYNRQYLVKYNGSMLKYQDGGVNTLPDQFDFGNGDTNLYITIANADAGWGPDYIPPPAEIKAFLLGWKMYDASNGSTTVPYTGTGTKGWYPINGIIGTDQAVLTLPTVERRHDGGWQPNRLIYELETPVQEVIHAIGDLTLNVGENDLTLKEGRIVGEKTNPVFEAGTVPLGDVYNVNNQYNIPSLLKYKADEIHTVYKNAVEEYGVVRYPNNTTTAGAMFQILASQYNPTAVYTVDYDPLYVWQVSAPITGADIDYRSSLGSVVENLVDEVSSSSNDIVNLQNGKVNKLVEPASVRLTLVNGYTGELWITMLEDGHIILETRSTIQPPVGGFNVNKKLTKIPKGLRPLKATLIPGSFTGDISTINTPNVVLWIHPDGDIIPGTSSGGIYPTFINGSFKGGI